MIGPSSAAQEALIDERRPSSCFDSRAAQLFMIFNLAMKDAMRKISFDLEIFGVGMG